MKLDVANFFRYYIFHPQATEISPVDKRKATIALVALSVLSLGIFPLFSFIFFYDKSFLSSYKWKQLTKEENLSVKKIQELEKTMTDRDLLCADLWKVIPVSDSDSEREAKFQALFKIEATPLGEPRGKKLLQEFSDSKLMSYSSLFSEAHWSYLKDEQVIPALFSTSSYQKEKLQKAAEGLFNKDKLRYKRLWNKLTPEIQEKLRPYLKTNLA